MYSPYLPPHVLFLSLSIYLSFSLPLSLFIFYSLPLSQSIYFSLILYLYFSLSQSISIYFSLYLSFKLSYTHRRSPPLSLPNAFKHTLSVEPIPTTHPPTWWTLSLTLSLLLQLCLSLPNAFKHTTLNSEHIKEHTHTHTHTHTHKLRLGQCYKTLWTEAVRRVGAAELGFQRQLAETFVVPNKYIVRHYGVQGVAAICLKGGVPTVAYL